MTIQEVHILIWLFIWLFIGMLFGFQMGWLGRGAVDADKALKTPEEKE